MSHYLSLLTDTVVVAPYVGSDENGDPLYGPKYKIACRYEQSSTMVRDTEGREVLSTERLSLASPVRQRDLVWLPGKNDADEREAREPISVRSTGRPDRTLEVHRAFF